MQSEVTNLKKAFSIYSEKHTFEVGQVVRWKPGMKHIRATGPFIVMEVLKNPIIDDETSAGSTYFKEPLDILLGTIDTDRGFVEFWFDSSRFEPFSE